MQPSVLTHDTLKPRAIKAKQEDDTGAGHGWQPKEKKARKQSLTIGVFVLVWQKDYQELRRELAILVSKKKKRSKGSLFWVWQAEGEEVGIGGLCSP